MGAENEFASDLYIPFMLRNGSNMKAFIHRKTDSVLLAFSLFPSSRDIGFVIITSRFRDRFQIMCITDGKEPAVRVYTNMMDAGAFSILQYIILNSNLV